MHTDESVSDDVVAVVEKRPVRCPLFIGFLPLHAAASRQMQRHT